MLVKCKICGEKIDKSIAYKVVINSKNNYYCNEKEYNDWAINKKEKNDVYETIYFIFGRRVTNTVLYKEIGQLAEIYTYKSILGYLKENKEFLSSVMEKEFKSEYAQIRYFAAILKNNLADYSHVNLSIDKNTEYDMPDFKYKRKKARKSLIEYEEEVGDE